MIHLELTVNGDSSGLRPTPQHTRVLREPCHSLPVLSRARHQLGTVRGGHPKLQSRQPQLESARSVAVNLQEGRLFTAGATTGDPASPCLTLAGHMYAGPLAFPPRACPRMTANHQEYGFGAYKGTLASRQISAKTEGLLSSGPHPSFIPTSSLLSRVPFPPGLKEMLSALLRPRTSLHWLCPGLYRPPGASRAQAFPLPTELCGFVRYFFPGSMSSLCSARCLFFLLLPKWWWSPGLQPWLFLYSLSSRSQVIPGTPGT